MTGVNWYENIITISPAFLPGSELTSKNYYGRLIYIPLLLRYDFTKYLFVNGGLLADCDISKGQKISKQTGVGGSIGLCTEFLLSKKNSLQINPY